MKKIVISLMLALFAFTNHAQTLADLGKICISVAPVKQNDVPESAKRVLENKLRQMLSPYGIVDNGIERRFEMTSAVDVLSKDIIAGAPPRISQKLEITLEIRDAIENKTYGTTSFQTVGVGLSEEKAFIKAFSSAGKNSIMSLVEDSKARIIDFYNTHADRMIKDAAAAADKGDYDYALYLLSSVPDVCTQYYDKCQDQIVEYYYRKIDAEGDALFREAKALWAESPDANGAARAAEVLSKIDNMAACQNSVDALLAEIKKKVADDKKKEWEFTLRQYEDQKKREQRDFEFKVKKYNDDKAREQRDFDFSVRQFEEDSALKRAIVDAGKEVAIAYVKGR